ncbi:MAG: type II CAAX endopeptidase family protein [Gammaproteobacteria bacterium]|nr:type II CAAX endopeptidase family protein [Gammaproteobacteria bacterium]
MRVFLLFFAYLAGFLVLAAAVVPTLQTPYLDALGLEPASSLYRVPMLVAALALPLFLRVVALDSWRAAGYTLPRHAAWSALARGLVIGIAIMLALTAAQWLLDIHHFAVRESRWTPQYFARTLISGLLSGLAVGFIEETLFRGLMHTGMRRTLGFWATALLTALLYAVLHFVKPAELGTAAFTTAEAFRMIGDGLARPGDFAPIADSFVTLVVVGVFLSMVRERTGNVLWAIGIHAGWVMIIKLMKYLTDPTLVDGRASFWVAAGYDHITGWMATIWLVAIMGVYWCVSRPARKDAE